MDSFSLKRAQMVAILDRILSKGGRKRDTSQLTLFPTQIEEKVPDIQEWPLLQILGFEKSLLGIYLTSHPLYVYSEIVNYLSRNKIASFYEQQRNQEVTICGVVEKIKKITTRRKNEQMAILKIEDETASIEVFVFPRLYQEAVSYLRERAVLLLKGNIESKDRVPKILASKVIPADKIVDNIKGVNIFIEKDRLSLDKLKKIFLNNSGDTPVFFSFKDPRLKGIRVKTGDKFSIGLSEKALKEVESVVGKGNLSLTP